MGFSHFHIFFQFSSVQFSCSVMSDSLQPHESQHARPPCPSLTPGVHPDSGPSSQWCHPAISSSVVPFSSCPQSLPASESFPMTQLFTWGGQSTGVLALASFLPKKSQLPKPKYALKKGHGHRLVVCCSSDPLQLSESQQNHYIWDVRSGNQWDSLKTVMPTADTDQQKEPSFSLWQCPTTCHTTTTSKVERTGLQSLASSAVYTRPLANLLWLQASQLFLGEMIPQPAGGRRCFPTLHWIPKHGFLCYRNKQTYFSLAKMCWF